MNSLLVLIAVRQVETALNFSANFWICFSRSALSWQRSYTMPLSRVCSQLSGCPYYSSRNASRGSWAVQRALQVVEIGRPIYTSERQTRALPFFITRKSNANEKRSPPAYACPFKATSVGTDSVRSLAIKLIILMLDSTKLKSFCTCHFMSNPVENFLAPVPKATRTAGPLLASISSRNASI